jgi:chaperonin GroES
MQLTPLGSKVVLEPLAQEKMTQSGLVIPDTADKTRPMQGTVVAVGPGALTDSGTRTPIALKIGDQVLFKKYGPDEFEIEGKKYLVADEADILAVINQ